jgi:uncharacterized protein (TIGR00251 family)
MKGMMCGCWCMRSPARGKTALLACTGEAVKIRLAAPPVDGRANKELCRFLAEACGVAPSAVDVISGEGARAKRVRIKTPQMLPAALRELI